MNTRKYTRVFGNLNQIWYKQNFVTDERVDSPQKGQKSQVLY